MDASNLICSNVENKIRCNGIYTTKGHKFFELEFFQAFIELEYI